MTVTAGFITYVMMMEEVARAKWQQDSAIWLVPAFITYIICQLSIFCCRGVARKVPTNYIVLSLFTFAFSFLVTFITAGYPVDIVVQAALATALTTIALTIYAFKTDTDLTMMGGMMWILSVAMMMIILSFALFSPSSLYSPFLTGLLVCFYGLFLIYDTQLVAGGGQHKLDIDDYVIGAMLIYTDIIMLFLELLKLFSQR